MLFRLLIVFGCVVVFINGCNSLVSQFYGTHKLRTYTIQEVQQQGIGDADYVEITDAWRSGDYVHVPPVRRFDDPILIYPIGDAPEKSALKKVPIVAWEELFDPRCLEISSCVPQEKLTIRGIVRDIPKEKDQSAKLTEMGYPVSERPIYIEVGKAPLDWYWNLAMLLGALLLGAGIEVYHLRKTRNRQREY